jgi:hypothetical protein
MRLTKRLDTLHRQTQPTRMFQRILVSPEEWDEPDRLAYDHAKERGDMERQYALIERVTGQRIVPRQPLRLIELRMLGEDGA